MLFKSTGMNRSGFIMKIELYKARYDSQGRVLSLDELIGIQYQVVKVQKATEAASNKTTWTIYFVGSSSEATLKVQAQRLTKGKLRDTLTK